MPYNFSLYDFCQLTSNSDYCYVIELTGTAGAPTYTLKNVTQDQIDETVAQADITTLTLNEKMTYLTGATGGNDYTGDNAAQSTTVIQNILPFIGDHTDTITFGPTGASDYQLDIDGATGSPWLMNT